MSKLLNNKNCKRLILDTAAALGKDRKFSRVGASSFVWIEAQIRRLVSEEVRSHPSIGKTLYLGGREKTKPSTETT